MPESIKYKKSKSLWTYENGVLKNKYKVQNQDILNYIEKAIVNIKLFQIEIFVKNNAFEISDILKIHKFLFDDIYPFAGKIRNENIEKGNTVFCQFHLIKQELSRLLNKLETENPKNKKDMAKVIAHYYAELNMLHIFREGNGRTNRTFLKIYANKKGYELLFADIDPEVLLAATIYSVNNNETKLVNIFKKYITKLK